MTRAPTPTIPSDLAHLEASIWQTLVRAQREKAAAWRWPSLATVGTDDGAKSRIVVLRHADPITRTFVMYTDKRSEKVAELTRTPNAALLFFDPHGPTQLRACIETSIDHDSEETAKIWSSLPAPMRADYETIMAPGSPRKDGSAGENAASTAPTNDGAHFCRLIGQVHKLDWLDLQRTNHRRAHFLYDRANLTDARWLTP